ncbi:MAG: imidazole glycerol phosphate synthase subunit HisH [Chitinophagales bacterium]
MKNTVTVIDYGTGNLLSVVRALEYWGAEVQLSNKPEQVESTPRLVLPGVGAFGAGMNGLKERGLVEAIQRFAGSNRPFLGICLGMQLMLESSEEFGLCEGLGLVPGTVVSLPSTGVNGEPHKIPHTGWNSLYNPSGQDNWGNTILRDVVQGQFVYFVHSYAAVTAFEEHTLAVTWYHGRRISAVIKIDNMYGCQFHPEKSGPVGLRIIRNFLEIPVL